MPKKRTTIHDIARELNVTASTVSRALQDHPRISRQTKEAVLKAARELNYQHNSIAAALRKGKSNLVGIIVPTADRSFFGTIIRGIEEVVNESGYRVIISQSNDLISKERANIDTLLEAQVDGIFASIAKETIEFSHYFKIKKRRIPLILFDRVTEELETSTVAIDDFQGAYKAVQHLIDQGCRRIVHFSGRQSLSIYKERFKGYKQALLSNEILMDEQLVLYGDTQLKSGEELGKKILTMRPLPDAIFSASDFTAIGAMQYLKRHGIKIPEQIAIVGFSNEAFTSFVDPALSTIDQHGKRMGQAAAELFLKQIENSEMMKNPKKMVLDPDLIIRQSSLRHQSGLSKRE